MNLIFFGAPGAGKGTIANIIGKRLGIPHISTGNVFRKIKGEDSQIGRQVKELIDKGNFVPDDITIEIVKKRLTETDCKQGFILDGFPRTLKQAEFLDKITKIDLVINFYVDEDFLIRRLLARRSCPNCKKEYNLITSMKPKNNNELCDVCSVKLAKRADDNEQTIQGRQETYKKETAPLIKYYEEKGILKSVLNVATPEEVANDTIKVLK